MKAESNHRRVADGSLTHQLIEMLSSDLGVINRARD